MARGPRSAPDPPVDPVDPDPQTDPDPESEPDPPAPPAPEFDWERLGQMVNNAVDAGLAPIRAAMQPPKPPDPPPPPPAPPAPKDPPDDRPPRRTGSQRVADFWFGRAQR